MQRTWIWANFGRWWDREAWRAAVHGVTKSRTQLGDRTTTTTTTTHGPLGALLSTALQVYWEIQQLCSLRREAGKEREGEQVKDSWVEGDLKAYLQSTLSLISGSQLKNLFHCTPWFLPREVMSENFGNYFFKYVKNTIGQENQNKPLTQFAKACTYISA